MNPNSCKTVNPQLMKPDTRDPIPVTRNLKPEIRSPKPETKHPKSKTRNPKPETRNPKPESRCYTDEEGCGFKEKATGEWWGHCSAPPNATGTTPVTKHIPLLVLTWRWTFRTPQPYTLNPEL